MSNYNIFVNALRTNVCEVTFMKIDGTERVMNCTLRADFLPEQKEFLSENESNCINVWDVDKSAWRSFRVDSVSEFSVKEVNGSSTLLV